MSTVWSLLANQKDDGQSVFKQSRRSLLATSTGAGDAGAVVMLGPSGLIDTSMLPGSATGGYTMQVDGVDLPDEKFLNFRFSFSLVDNPANQSTDVFITALDVGTF